MSSRLTIKNHLDRVGSVEETLNALLETEADRCAALRTQQGTPRPDLCNPSGSDIQRIATGFFKLRSKNLQSRHLSGDARASAPPVAE